MVQKKEKILLIDGNAVVHRAYHALPPLTTKKGEIVNAVYGFAMILLNVLKELKPKYIAVAFDKAAPTFRHKEFAEYKATRPKTPEDLSPQFILVKKVLEAFNIPYFEKDGYEADDIIGTLTKHDFTDLESIIVTGDLDELQLVNHKTRVYTMRKGFTNIIIYDEKKVKERFGLPPEKLVDYKALKGDPSDNIPGVPGIGDKTATSLVKEFNSVENLFKNLDKVEGKIKSTLKKHQDQAFLSKKLATIITDIPLKIKLEDCETRDFDRQKIFELFRRLEFKSLLNKLPESKREDEEKDGKKGFKKLKDINYKTIDNKEDFKKLINTLKKQKIISIDLETDNLDAINANLVGISFSFKEKEAFYIPVGHASQQSTINNQQLDLEYVLKELKPVIEDRNIGKVGHNLKFDYAVLLKYGIEIKPIVFDTMIAAYLINPNLRSPRLSDIAFSELGYEVAPITKFIGEGKNQISFAEVKISDATYYSCEDADIALRLYHHLEKDLEEKDLISLFENIEVPLIPVLAKIENNGVKVNENFLFKMSKQLDKRIEKLRKDIYKSAGFKFNINSPAQLKEVLFGKLKLDEKIEDKKELKKVKTGGYSTAAVELEKLRDIHPIIRYIFEYRELVKLKTTYVDALPSLINPKTGRIHTSFNQAITATGRLSSSNPNLQNIPIRTKIGNEIRKAFVAERGYKLLAADYSQIELRIITHIAKDKQMIVDFHSKEDIHTRTAAAVFEVKPNKVTKEMRRAAKVVNFGVIYGISPYGLKQATGMNREEARDFIYKYFDIHKGIKKYMKEIKEVAKKVGYVESLFGRRRYLPEIKSANHIVKSQAERMALNMPIQGTAADLMKLAMIEIDNGLKNISSKTKMILQVHDELVFEVLDNDIKKVAKFVKDKMENIYKLNVPIRVDMEVGNNWGEMKEIKI